jgi:hypothetical protein
MSVRQQNGVNPTDVIYRPMMVFDSDMWDRILARLLGYSNVPFFCYQRNQRLYIQPIPSDSANVVLLRGRLKVRDINIADTTNITVVTAIVDSTTLVMSGSCVTSMIGQYIRITQTSAANGGDGYWYEIAAVPDATHLTLKKPYQGTAITAATAASIIGFITYEPEQYQMAPIYRAVAQFWDLKENMTLSERYWRAYDGGMEIGKADNPQGLLGQMLAEANESMEGPYITPTPRTGEIIDYPPYWFPYSDASGF